MAKSPENPEGPFTIEVDGTVKGQPLSSWKEAMGEARRQRRLNAGRTVLVRDHYLREVIHDTERHGDATTRDG